MNKRTFQIVMTTLGFLVCVGVANAQSPIVNNEEAKLLPSDGADYDEFGTSVAIEGNLALIGARFGDDDNGSNSGSAYIYRFDGSSWIETKLLASDGASDDYFGYSVAVSGDTVVVGAFLDDDNGSSSGSAYVYRFDGSSWQEEAKLLPSDGASDDQFGRSVAVSGDTVVVGALFDDDNGSASGSAYVYRFDGSSWIETKLLASDGASGERFGYSVAVDGDTVVVGAYLDDDNGSNSGSAYIYRFDGITWQEETKLLASDGASSDLFGTSVAVNGDTVVIGAHGNNDNGSSSGSAYVYRFDGSSWIETKLLASDGAEYDNFGYSVAVSGDTVVVGARYDDDNGSSSGSAYVYRFDGSSWVETKLLASDGAGSDEFGTSVAIDGNLALIGARFGDDDNGWDSGSAYIFITDVDGVMYVPKEYATIDDAIAHALQGSDIVLSEGTYTGTGDSVIDTLGKTLTIRSSSGPENTFIDGEGLRRGIACYNEETSTGMPVVTIEGLTITNGYAEEGGGLLSIGGTTNISDCIFTMNDAFFGAGVNIIDPELGPTITGTHFEENSANFGGGIYLSDCTNDVVISDCGFYENSATYGGGIYNLRGFAELVDIRMSGNSAYEGGGIFELESISYISDSWFGANMADVGGSSINNHISYSEIIDSMFCSPSDDGHITGGWSDLGGNIFADECDDCNGNGEPDIIEIKLNPSLDCNGNMIIDSCEVDDGSANDCNANGLPDECDLVNDPALDCDGNGLIDFCEVKDGSANDCNANGLPDACDIANGTSQDIDGNAIPDECEDCNVNDIPDGMDMADCDGSPWCSDCNENGELDSCDIASGESNDVNENGIPDSCECLQDVNGDFIVNVADVLAVIADWGSTAGVPADVNDDGIVDVLDLLDIVGSWGPCE